ncbi:prolyl oligopeptidase family serine peptidase [Muricauda oceani]|uniref:Prolyl oligopeptidase family serine peptidase n=1 Tax=Flagellimonas oceani TaxID=2698672 RepID=A0A6G7IZY1_9FLAO|nr:PHB depolymerase family esterase [Allomuricauda oceani]MBW8244187.1 prolyl oligopeptidase family serine peptidase [Allomuricauda oceani]QII44161.1 prolyl oligopeptidase family serine peptidase [Allomuricauda oceani]
MQNKVSRFFMFLGMSMLQACAAQSHLVQDELETVTTENVKYYLYYPEDYFDSQSKEFGLLLFLHGGGESGRNVEEIKDTGPPKMLVEGKQFPFLILAPQNPHAKKWWNTDAVVQLLDSVVQNNRVDKNRIYLSGLSRGGSASWELATQFPDKFAAMAVVCGMAPLPYAHWIDKNMPIWVFHGDQDDVIHVKESDDMVKKLREMGHNIRYTRYNGVGHNVWDRAYTTDSLYTWLAAQKRIK